MPSCKSQHQRRRRSFTWRPGRASNQMRSIAAEGLAQFVLGALEHALLPLREVLAGAIEVEGQHRHCRAVRRTLAPAAGFRRALQRQRNLMRVVMREDAMLQIERVATPGDAGRPALIGVCCRHAVLPAEQRPGNSTSSRRRLRCLLESRKLTYNCDQKFSPSRLETAIR